MPRRRSLSAGLSAADLTAAVAAATDELAARDPVLARLVTAAGPCELDARRGLSHFGSLCRSITFQQLAGRAPAPIISRCVGAPTARGVRAVTAAPGGAARPARGSAGPPAPG